MAGEARRQSELVQSDTTNIISCLGHVPHTTVAVSRRPSSRWAVDAEKVGGGWGCPQRMRHVAISALTRLGLLAKKGRVGGAVAGSWRRWWSRGGRAAERCGRRLPGAVLRFGRPL